MSLVGQISPGPRGNPPTIPCCAVSDHAASAPSGLTGEGPAGAASDGDQVLDQVLGVGGLAAAALAQQHHRLVLPRGQQAAVRRLGHGVDVRRRVLPPATLEHVHHLGPTHVHTDTHTHTHTHTYTQPRSPWLSTLPWPTVYLSRNHQPYPLPLLGERIIVFYFFKFKGCRDYKCQFSFEIYFIRINVRSYFPQLIPGN